LIKGRKKVPLQPTDRSKSERQRERILREESLSQEKNYVALFSPSIKNATETSARGRGERRPADL